MNWGKIYELFNIVHIWYVVEGWLEQSMWLFSIRIFETLNLMWFYESIVIISISVNVQLVISVVYA